MRAPRRVVLTRTPEDNAVLRRLLDGLEAELVDHPCIAVEPLPVDRAIAGRLASAHYTTLVFPSRNAVDALLSQVEAAPPSQVIAIGPATAEALSRRGWPVTGMPSEARAEVFVRESASLLPKRGAVLHVRGDQGLPIIPDGLRAAGWELDEVVVYRTVDPRPAPLPADARPTLVVFASPSAVRHFAARESFASSMEALAIGRTTEAALHERGWPARVASSTEPEAIAAAVRAWCGVARAME